MCLGVPTPSGFRNGTDVVFSFLDEGLLEVSCFLTPVDGLYCGVQVLILSAGIRVSLYNAITEDETDKLARYIHEFIDKENESKKI